MSLFAFAHSSCPVLRVDGGHLGVRLVLLPELLDGLLPLLAVYDVGLRAVLRRADGVDVEFAHAVARGLHPDGHVVSPLVAHAFDLDGRPRVARYDEVDFSCRSPPG